MGFSSLTRDRTRNSSTGTPESLPLNHQGSPSSFQFSHGFAISGIFPLLFQSSLPHSRQLTNIVYVQLITGVTAACDLMLSGSQASASHTPRGLGATWGSDPADLAWGLGICLPTGSQGLLQPPLEKMRLRWLGRPGGFYDGLGWK